MRRLALGSGLDLAKLADTIRQVADSDPPTPVMICQDQANADAWVHLALASPEKDEEASTWVLLLGYPLRDDLNALLRDRQVDLPAGSRVTAWEPGLHATIHIPSGAPLETIARVIQQVMIGIQRVSPSAPIELALEYP